MFWNLLALSMLLSHTVHKSVSAVNKNEISLMHGAFLSDEFPFKTYLTKEFILRYSIVTLQELIGKSGNQNFNGLEKLILIDCHLVDVTGEKDMTQKSELSFVQENSEIIYIIYIMSLILVIILAFLRDQFNNLQTIIEIILVFRQSVDAIVNILARAQRKIQNVTTMIALMRNFIGQILYNFYMVTI